jgi:trafficking protein particle complex subunit 8
MSIFNAGTLTIDEVWVVAGSEDELWVGDDGTLIQNGKPYTYDKPLKHLTFEVSESEYSSEVFRSNNTLAPQGPYQLSLKGNPLNPGDTVSVSVMLHATQIALQHLCLLFVFREVEYTYSPIDKSTNALIRNLASPSTLLEFQGHITSSPCSKFR